MVAINAPMLSFSASASTPPAADWTAELGASFRLRKKMRTVNYYGDLLADGKPIPKFERLLPGAIGYAATSGRPVFYGRNKSTPKYSQNIPPRPVPRARVGNGVPKALRDWYPDSFR